MATPSDQLPPPDPPAVGQPRRLHPSTPLFSMLRAFGRLGIFVVFVLATGGLSAVPVLFAIAGVLGYQYVAWTRFSYQFDGDVLRIDEGVLSRSQRLVPCERIQKVDVVANVLHRMLDVSVLRVETAGGPGGAEVDLAVLATPDAQRLRAALLAAKAAAATATAAPAGPDGSPAATPGSPPERVLVRIGPAHLALAGVTGAQMAVMFAVVGWIGQALRDVPPAMLERVDPGTVNPPGEVAVAMGVLLLVLLWVGLAAGTSIVTDAGYTLSLAEGEIRVRRGLLERKEATIPLVRVQAVRVQRSVVRRLFGMVAVRIQSASEGGKSSRVSVPILADGEVEPLLAALLPGSAPVPRLHPHPRAALHRALVRRVGPALLGATLVAVTFPPWGLLTFVAVPAAAGLGVAFYRSLGHARLPDHVVARAGVLVEETVVVPVAKAQSARVRATWFQRRRGLATMFVDVAGGGANPRVQDEAEPRAEELLAGVIEDERVSAAGTLR